MKPQTNKPRQIRRSAPPGSLLKRLFGLHEQARKWVVAGDDPVYLARVRQLPCLKCGMEPCGTAAHLRANSGTFNKHQAMARKSSSKWTLPLCPACHMNDCDSQHKVGERIFWGTLGINPFLACEQLYAGGDDLVKLRAITLRIISGRER